MPRAESSTSQVCTLPETFQGSTCGGLPLARMLQQVCMSATFQVDLPLGRHRCSALGSLVAGTVTAKVLRRVVK